MASKPAPNLEDQYNALITGEMRAADIPWQERMGAEIYGTLKRVQDWARTRGDSSTVQGLGIGQLVDMMVSGPLENAEKSARGTPNVYADFSSENPLNWRLKEPAAELALSAADVIDPGIGSAALMGMKRVPKLWNGVMSTNTGKAGPIKKIADEGLKKGWSAELKENGASTSRDPLVSLVGFTDRRDEIIAPQPGDPYPRLSNPDQMLAVDMLTPKENVVNMPPDFMAHRIKTEDPNAVINMPNLGLMESETLAKYEKGQAAQGVKPRFPTPDEKQYLKQEAANWDEYHSKYRDMVGRLGPAENAKGYWDVRRVPPVDEFPNDNARSKDYMRVIGNIKGNRGRFEDVMTQQLMQFSPMLGTGVGTVGTSSNEFIDRMARGVGGEEAMQPILEAALKWKHARGARVTLESQLDRKLSKKGIKKGDTIEKIMSRTGGDITNIGDPELRQMYRDDVKARNALYDTMYNSIYRMDGGLTGKLGSGTISE